MNIDIDMYTVFSLVFQKKYFSNNSYSFINSQLINHEIYNIFTLLLQRDICALKLKKYFRILELDDMDFAYNIVETKYDFEYTIKTLGSLEFLPEFNFFNKKDNRYHWNNIGARNYEIHHLDILKVYKTDILFKKRRLLHKLSKLGLHYPVPSRSRYIYDF